MTAPFPHRSLLLLALALGCSDHSLVGLDKFAEDTAALDSADPDTGDTGDVPDEHEPEETDCHRFVFTWVAPVVADLHIEGELQGADGGVVLPWQRLTGVVHGSEVSLEMKVCGATAFRGEAVADLNQDGIGDTWSCLRTSDGSFALAGSLSASLDGIALTPRPIADPTSLGCGLLIPFDEVLAR